MLRPLAASAVLLGLLSSTGCRNTPVTVSPAPDAPAVPPSEAPSAEKSAEAEAALQAATRATARMSYNLQGEVNEEGTGIFDLLPHDLERKAVRLETGGQMRGLKLAPGQAWEHMTILTLEPQESVSKGIARRLAELGFVAEPAVGPSPAPTVYTLKSDTRLQVSYQAKVGQPLRVDLDLTTPRSGDRAGWPRRRPSFLGQAPPGLVAQGYETGHYHAVVAGGVSTDVERIAVGFRAQAPATPAALIAQWSAVWRKAGFAPRAGNPDHWERKESSETLVVVYRRDTPAAPEEVLLSYQRRWRR